MYLLRQSADPAFLVDSGPLQSYYHAADGSGAVSQVRARPAPHPSVAFPTETQKYPGGGLPMILQLHKTKPAPDICLITFTGKLMMGNDSRQVEWSISELLIAGIKKIIFDLSKLDGIDSTGVGILVVCQAKMQKAGGMLRIAGPHGIVQETLTLTHVDKLVPFFPSVDLAAQNFNPS